MPTPASVPIEVGTVVRGALAAGQPEQRYHFTGTTGEVVRVFFRAEPGADAGTLVVELLHPDGSVISDRRSGGRDTTLLNNAMPALNVLATGRYTVRVRGASRADRGAYSLLVAALRHDSIAVGDTVDWQTLEHRNQELFYSFDGIAGQEISIFLQAQNPANRDPIGLQLRRHHPGGTYDVLGRAQAASIRADGRVADLEANATGRVLLPTTGRYHVAVRNREASMPEPYIGAFRFWIRPIDRAPERLPAAIVLGDTIDGEAIDHAGDVDEFTFEGVEGQEVNIFFQARGTPEKARLELELLGGGEREQWYTTSTRRDTSLTRQSTGRVRLPATGEYTIQVRGESDRDDTHLGGYRFLAYPIDRAPETAPATLVLGDSIVGERIDLPGDIDEFTLQVRDSTLATLAFQLEDDVPLDAAELHFLGGPARERVRRSYAVSASDVASPSYNVGTVALSAGTYTLQVLGAYGPRSPFQGGYRIYTFVTDEAPEQAPARIAIGDTITETLAPLGDIDVFHFSGKRRQHVDIRFQGTGEPSHWGFELGVFNDRADEWLAVASAPRSAPSLESGGTGRVTLPEDGDYRIRIMGRGGAIGEHISYRMAIVEAPTDPEHISPYIAVGDSVTGERIDWPGDIDAFTLTGAPGQEASIFFHFAAEGGGDIDLAVYDIDPDTVIASATGNQFVHSTGRFRLPASGRARIEVMQHRPGCRFQSDCVGFSQAGPYWFHVAPINRAPEQVAAGIAIGQIVEGEAIRPAGDIDEFHFSGTAGENVRVDFQTPYGVPSEGLILELFEPATGTVLASVRSEGPTDRLEDQSTSIVRLDATATFGVRVRGYTGRREIAEYRFRVRRVD